MNLLANENTPIEVIVKYNGDIKALAQELNIPIEILNPSYAIILVQPQQMTGLRLYPQIEYLEPASRLALLENPSIANSCISNVRKGQKYNLSGNGTIVAILDSGIDYQHPDFVNPDGTTRILCMWDQNQSGTPPEGFTFGTEYSMETINEALMAPENERDSIIKQLDFNGHGTAVAGIAAGNGRGSNGQYMGVAPEASLIVVKLAANVTQYFTSTTNLMRGVKYVIDKAIEYNMPISINISYGNNQGSHDGNSLFEQYLDSMADMWKTSIVVPTGNEGTARHHFQGSVSEKQTVDVQFTSQQGLHNLPITLTKSFIDIFEFRILSSSGETSRAINLRQLEQTVLINNTEIVISIAQPTPYAQEQNIIFLFRGLGGAVIPENIWTIQVTGINIIEGEFNLWLPVTEISGSGTEFLYPTLNTTLTIPSTAQKVVSVGGYDSQNGNFSEFSGRGFTRTGGIKPDLVAPAESIISTAPGSGYGAFTGTSFAAPHVAGACCLMMQWGIVQNNDPYLYGQRLKAFLRSGSRRSPNMIYPNSNWGFGTLCIEKSLDLVSYYNYDRPSSYPSTSYFEIPNAESGPDNQNRISEATNTSENSNMSTSINVSEDQTDISNTGNTQIVSSIPESQSISPLEQKLRSAPPIPDNVNPILDESYIDSIAIYDARTEKLLKNFPGIQVSLILQGGYAIVHAPIENINEYRSVLENRVVAEVPIICGLLEDPQALIDSGITAVKNQPYLDLKGNGVIIGVIDTGIDYTLPAFKYENGNSKILYLWDQSIQDGPPPKGFVYGTEYTNQQINAANQSDNPYNIVPSRDEIGHGTFLSALMAARTNQDSTYSGAAPGADIIAVKLKSAKISSRRSESIYNDEVPAYSSADIMAGIEYLFRKSIELGQPLVISIGLGSNNGAHDGLSFFERYISGLSLTNGTGIICAVGNEGNMSHHFYSDLSFNSISQIEFNVSANNPGFMMNIWAFAPDRISISLTTPLGSSIERKPFTVNERQNYTFVLEGTEIYVEYMFPNIKNGNQEIKINFKNPTAGLWVLNIYGDLILDGRIHGWLPLSPFIDPRTNFLQANVSYTVTIPSTSYNIIDTGAYNSNDGSIYISTGRGPSISEKVCPDLVAPGVNVTGLFPTGQTGTMTGTSVSSAITTGASALIMQWGIVNDNDRTMNTLKLRSYLLLGLRQRPGISYPDDLWGYGELDLMQTFQRIR